MTTALLDGDILAFRAAAAAEQSVAWEPGEAAEVYADAQGAARAALETVEAWARLARCKDIIVAFTGRANFRKLVLPTYKHNRTGKSKPLAYVCTVDAVKAAYPTHVVEGLEADDLLGLMVTGEKHREAIVVSLDKDMRTLPGRHLNPLKEDRPVIVTLAEADHKWMTQTITGDTTDGYTGIPKRGPKAAEKALGPPGDGLGVMWPKVVKAARDAGMSLADLLAQARVARILRSGDYDKIAGRVKLWTPPGTEDQWLDIKEI